MEASKLFVPGMWMCPQCGFIQQNNVISPRGVFADSKPELRPCPNDGRDMQAVTWQEYAERTDKAFGKVLDEREALQRALQVIYDLEVDLKKEGMERFEDYFCHWNTIIHFAAGAGVSGYAQDPMELLATLVNQRDEAREQLAKMRSHWTRTPPTEQGMYWMWQGEDTAPFPVSVLWSGCAGKCFLPMGQWGWTEPQDVDSEDLAGTWWMPCPEPPLPETEGGAQ
jgi:hypothetical protein